MSKSASSPFVVVQRRPNRRPLLWAVLAGAWLFSLAGTWAVAGWRAAPALPGVSSELSRTRRQLEDRQAALEELRQREVTAARSDQISRVANKEMQRELTAREDEIAGLRADVAFYERLMGPGAKPHALNVHSAEFNPATGGAWQYLVVLTQNLNRGAVSAGQMRMTVEGVRDGKLATISWDELHQRPAAPEQSYSFRYFQRLKGSVMLPPDFTPQRIRVSLRGGGTPVEQAFGWKDVSATGDT